MSTQRYISTSFWDDPWISSLDPSEKFVYLYLMTNPLTNIAGVYEITERRICFDTGYNQETISRILERFDKSGKAKRYKNYTIIISWPKHQKWKKRSKIRDGIISVLQELPRDILIYLNDVDYMFDLTIVDSTIISSKQRKNISGSTKKRVFDKYNNKCTDCGSTNELNIHHVKSLKDGGDNSFDNLSLLCSKCHTKTHSPDTLSGLNPESIYVPNYSDLDLDSDIDTNKDIDIDVDPPKPKLKRFVAPSIDEIKKHCEEKGYYVNPDKFFFYYESNGWKVGKNKMKSWQMALGKWNADAKPFVKQDVETTEEEAEAIWK